MELYISDHPLDCLTCPANGDCELQDMAGAVGLREVRYGYDGANHLHAGEGRVQPLLHLRPGQVHRLLPLRARLRGGAGHLRADHRRAAASTRTSSPARTSRSSTPSACPAAPASRPARPRRCMEKRVHRASASPSAAWSPPAPTAASAARFKAEMQGNERRAHGARTRTARPTTATPASRAASPGATRPTRTASPSR